MNWRFMAPTLAAYRRVLSAWAHRLYHAPWRTLRQGLPRIFQVLALCVFVSIMIILLSPWKAGYTVEAQTEILKVKVNQKLMSWWLQDARIKLDILKSGNKVDCGTVSGALTLNGNMEISYEIRDTNVLFLRATSRSGLDLWLRNAERKFVDCGPQWQPGVKLAAVYVRLGEPRPSTGGGDAKTSERAIDRGATSAAPNWPTLALAGQVVLGRLPSDQSDQNNPFLLQGTVRTLARSWGSNERYEAASEDLLLGDTLHFIRTEDAPDAKATDSTLIMGYGEVRVGGAVESPHLHVVWRTAGEGLSYRISHYGSAEETGPPGLSIATRISHDPILQLLLALMGFFAAATQMFQVNDRKLSR